MAFRNKQFIGTKKVQSLQIAPTSKDRDPRYRTSAWKQYSYRLRTELHMCGVCELVGTQEKFSVDHIIPIVYGGSFWDRRNHQVLCHKCHNKKTATERIAPTVDKWTLNESGDKIPVTH